MCLSPDMSRLYKSTRDVHWNLNKRKTYDRADLRVLNMTAKLCRTLHPHPGSRRVPRLIPRPNLRGLRSTKHC